MLNIDMQSPTSTIITKEYIKHIKLMDKSSLSNLIKAKSKNLGELVFILEHLGTLPESFDASWLLPLLNYENENVRYLTVKNIGKLKSETYLKKLYETATNDTSTIVKREAVSSIGRMRNENTIPLLIKILSDEDPKITCQAIRGLLVFKGNKKVDFKLKELINHENETVRTIIYKEYFTKKINKKDNLPHAETYKYLKNIVVCGDVHEVLKNVPNESIHLTFTSPPYYNARDYSIYPSYDAYLNFLKDVFTETYRVTKEGRFLIVNTSPVIIPRISRSHSSKRYPIPFDLHYYLTQIGWEFIDDIIWMKPEYSVKNRIGGFQQHRKPLAYKPNPITEYLMVYRKQTEKLLDWNMQQYEQNIINSSKVDDGFETTNVWQICPKSDRIHSAVFPEELCQRVIKYYSFKGDLIFDPFAGSGTVGQTSTLLDRSFFLTEKEPTYFEYIKFKFNSLSMFSDNKTKFLTLEQFIEETK